MFRIRRIPAVVAWVGLGLGILGGCANHRLLLSSASPPPPESLGLFLEAEPRKGTYDRPYRTLCNVNLRTLNNLSIPIWVFPRVTFYAEQNGEVFRLRRIETHSGGVSRPFSVTGKSVTLPRPPRSGRWRVFAIQEFSMKVYERHLETHRKKDVLTSLEEFDPSLDYLWNLPLRSNALVVDFADLSDDEKRSAERVIEGLIEAGQYETGFSEPVDDPERSIRRR